VNGHSCERWAEAWDRADCLFEREHHRRIATILTALDAERLSALGCLFGGGTAIALRHGEYRESVDIDFLVSKLQSYRELRQSLSGSTGIQAIVKSGATLLQSREVRADQYDLRTMLRVDGVGIKFEIVLEARIQLEAPTLADRVCGVAALTPLDAASTKLLANSDRWRDDAVFSRDLIDLAMLAPPKRLLQRAIAKSKVAYGDSIELDLAKAIEDLRARPHRLDECMRAMHMTTVSKASLWSRIKALAR
jgi:hypothetical protein